MNSHSMHRRAAVMLSNSHSLLVKKEFFIFLYAKARVNHPPIIKSPPMGVMGPISFRGPISKQRQ